MNSKFRRLARDVVAAQQSWRETHVEKGHELLKYNTFVCTSPFEEFEEKYPEIVATDSQGSDDGQCHGLLLPGKTRDVYDDEGLGN
jgi:hypothetical protein